MYACLAVTCHLHFWQNDRDFLRATVVTRGWNGYRNKSQHRKSTLEKKILPPFQQGFEPATFQSRVRCSNHWAIPAPCNVMCAALPYNLSEFPKTVVTNSTWSNASSGFIKDRFAHILAALFTCQVGKMCRFYTWQVHTREESRRSLQRARDAQTVKHTVNKTPHVPLTGFLRSLEAFKSFGKMVYHFQGPERLQVFVNVDISW